MHNTIVNVNGFTIFYTMFKTTLVVRCSQYSLRFFKSNSVWFESPIFQYSSVLFLTSCTLLLKLNRYLHSELRIFGKELCKCIKSNEI